MKPRRIGIVVAVLLATLAVMATTAFAANDPLPSWQNGATKTAIISFVEKVTTKDGPDYVPSLERIAVFDNDGTLWSEQPMYFQVFFILDRLKQMAPSHPEWQKSQAVQAALSGDKARLAKLGNKGLLEITGLITAGQTSSELTGAAADWLETARHPQKKMLFKRMTYQPMVELLAYLRDNGFKTFIVSGGGVDFIRAFSDEAYGIPSEQIIGTSLKSKWGRKDGKPAVLKLPQINSIDDKEGKPINIDLHIGKRPIIAVGNSDGDQAMLQWTAAGDGPRLMMLVHHDDAGREFAYDRKSHVGRLDKALDQAQKDGWTVVSMKNDFVRIYPSPEK